MVVGALGRWRRGGVDGVVVNEAPSNTSHNQSVAAFVSADRAAFYSCGFYSSHNTLLDNEGYDRCYIQGAIDIIFGRPKGDHSRVVFANTYMSKSVRPEGWSDWNHHGSLENVDHAEYNCHGPGSSSEGRVRWLKKLNGQEAAPFLSTDFIDGKQWLLV
ncbi:hypothetical protein L1987_86985 [Smallanthus sonchifolius]|uniref:Uncharacterized protein n=1 Tax=Smallanthus sonchifolius TaxID=185202 RepID=A0ACB8Y2E3_9ASTR|nr:hypothetical protein L1987_86985 [Smallanthus sonchifolius]